MGSLSGPSRAATRARSHRQHAMSTISTRFIRESLGRIIRVSTLTSLIAGSPRSTPFISHKNTKQVMAPFASCGRIG
jgi:hypothetical protein